jgi:hypothetical protein
MERNNTAQGETRFREWAPRKLVARGEGLGLVYVAGEVVVDFSLRLKKELNGKRWWVAAYANDVPCYIATKWPLPEVVYEAKNGRLCITTVPAHAPRNPRAGSSPS